MLSVKLHRILFATLIGLGGLGVTGPRVGAATPDATRVEPASLQAANVRGTHLETVLSGLSEPRAFEFLSDDEVLISERGGRLLRYRFGDDKPRTVAGLPEISTQYPQSGLLDVALHPQFAKNGRIYFTFSKADAQAPQYTLTALASARLVDLELRILSTLVEAGPYGWAPANYGGAIAFDANGHLYVTLGDRADHDLAQRGDRLQGKILRLTDDGDVPKDNPFIADPQIDDRIFALGLRNPQGLYFDAPSSLLFEAEHGPMGGDEVNIIRAGANYGWPTVTYGKNYTGEEIGIGTHAAGMAQPIWYYTPSIAASPLLVYRGAMFPEWQGDLLIGALRGQHVSRLDLDGEVVRSAQTLLTELDARIRDLKVAPDGAVFVLTQSGNLHRLARNPEASAPSSRRPSAQEVYTRICAGCHASGAYQAPNPDQPDQWQAILATPPETSYLRTVKGHGAMPERGLCHVCTDDLLREVVDWMRKRAASPPSDQRDGASSPP
jgi:glucose/arabinose dehydrogenase